MMMTDQDRVDEYLRTLGHALGDAPAGAREAALDDVRAHIADARGEGRSVDETLNGLGSAEIVAQQYRDELGLPAAAETTAVAESPAARMLHWGAVALGVLTAVFVAFLLPMYSSATESSGSYTSSSGSGSNGPDVGELVHETTETLVQVNGPGAAVVALLPAVIALLPIVLPRAGRRPAAIAGATVVTLFTVIGGFTIGGFYLPLAAMMWAAVIVDLRPSPSRVPLRMHGEDPRPSAGPGSFAGGLVVAVLLALPGVVLFVSTLGGAVQFDAVVVVMTAVSLGLAVAFAFGKPWAYLATAAIGALVMVFTLFDAGMLVLATWWIGGLYLVAGLTAFLARRPR